MLHKQALRAVYHMQYWTTIGNADNAEMSKQRLGWLVDAMREIGEDVSLADYIDA